MRQFLLGCVKLKENGEYIFSPREKFPVLRQSAQKRLNLRSGACLLLKCFIALVMLQVLLITRETFSEYWWRTQAPILVYLQGNKLHHVYTADIVVIMQNFTKSIPRHFSVMFVSCTEI